MVSHQCGFFHVFSNDLFEWMSCHTLNSWMVSHQYGFFHVSSNYLTWSICSCTLSNWMVYHQCGFFHGSSNDWIVSICSHILSSWMVYHQYGFFHVASNCLILSIYWPDWVRQHQITPPFVNKVKFWCCLWPTSFKFPANFWSRKPDRTSHFLVWLRLGPFFLADLVLV